MKIYSKSGEKVQRKNYYLSLCEGFCCNFTGDLAPLDERFQKGPSF